MRCPNCKEKVARFPLKDSNGNIIWINLFKMDLMSIIWTIVIIVLIVTWTADTETCREITTDPLKYCEESNACKIIEERKSERPYGMVDIENMPEIDIK